MILSDSELNASRWDGKNSADFILYLQSRKTTIFTQKEGGISYLSIDA